MKTVVATDALDPRQLLLRLIVLRIIQLLGKELA